MPITQHRIVLATTAGVILTALVIAGCGRRDLPAAAGPSGAAGPTVVATQSAAPTPAAPTPPAASPAGMPSAVPVASPPTGSTAPSPQDDAAPIAAPDLTAIDRLLTDIDAALGADATADSDEGSAR